MEYRRKFFRYCSLPFSQAQLNETAADYRWEPDAEAVKRLDEALIELPLQSPIQFQQTLRKYFETTYRVYNHVTAVQTDRDPCSLTNWQETMYGYWDYEAEVDRLLDIEAPKTLGMSIDDLMELPMSEYLVYVDRAKGYIERKAKRLADLTTPPKPPPK